MSKVEIGRDAEHKPIICTYNDEWSFRDFTNKGKIKENLDGLTIYASSFYQESDGSLVDVFPDDVKNLTLVKCHVENVKIPVGVILVQCFTDRIAVQNDGNDWIVDENKQPIKPINHNIFTKLGLEMPKPEDIPAEKVSETIDLLEIAKNK